MSIKAAKIRDGQEIGRFLYSGDPNALPMTKGLVTIVPVVEEREQPDAYHSVTGPVTTIEEARVVDTWTKVPRGIEVVTAARLADLATERYARECGGIVVAGAGVATDDRSKTLLMGAKLKAQADANYTVNWKVGPGVYAPLDAATIIGVADAVEAWVGACFEAEKVHAEAIVALAEGQNPDPADIIAYDFTGGWPSPGE